MDDAPSRCCSTGVLVAPSPTSSADWSRPSCRVAGMESLAWETGGKTLIGNDRLGESSTASPRTRPAITSQLLTDRSQLGGRFRSLRSPTTAPAHACSSPPRATTRCGARRCPARRTRPGVRQAMHAPRARIDLPVAASVGTFASAEGWPVLVLSAGGRPPSSNRKTPLRNRTCRRSPSSARRRRGLARAHAFERRLDAPLDLARYERGTSDRRDPAMTDMVPLLPGEDDWRMVFRDERSGKSAAPAGRPAQGLPRAVHASSLLLTRQVVAPEDGRPPGPTEHQPLDAGSRGMCRSPRWCSAGRDLHRLYRVYNATTDGMEAAKQGMKSSCSETAGRWLTSRPPARPSWTKARADPVRRGHPDWLAQARQVHRRRDAAQFETRSTKQVKQRFLLIASTLDPQLELVQQSANILQWSFDSECP